MSVSNFLIVYQKNFTNLEKSGTYILANDWFVNYSLILMSHFSQEVCFPPFCIFPVRFTVYALEGENSVCDSS
jgi:hypothetical protein